MDEDSKGQRKTKDSGGGLLPAMEGHSLEQNRIGSRSRGGVPDQRPQPKSDM